MKSLKKMACLVLALVLLVAMAVPAGAVTITIENGAAGAQYSAYQLLKAESLGADKYAFTVNSKYSAALQTATGQTTDDAVVEYLAAQTSDSMRGIADAIYAQIKTMDADLTTTNDTLDGDMGYYLIAETKTGADPDTYSLIMVNTAGVDGVTVETKEDAPTMTKKLKETNDTTGTVTDWQDGADYDIGDEVPFQLKGTVSSFYDKYAKYYYAFHDTMSAGLSFDAASVKVFVDGTEITDGYEVVTDCDDGCTFKIEFADLKQIAAVKASSEIEVQFKAELNEHAVIGSAGNPNVANLEFSNNPYKEEETDKTPDDKVIVFTFQMDVNKVTKSEDGEGTKPLEGAGFTLYKKNAKGEYDQIGNELTGVTTFTFTGLDAGEYKLEESTVPAGYNKVEDITFTVAATYDTDKADPKFGELTVTNVKIGTVDAKEGSFTVNNGVMTTDVVNLSGLQLPSTGGIGTTIFYVVGGALVLAAVVLLVTKRRVNASN